MDEIQKHEVSIHYIDDIELNISQYNEKSNITITNDDLQIILNNVIERAKSWGGTISASDLVLWNKEEYEIINHFRILRDTHISEFTHNVIKNITINKNNIINNEIINKPCINNDNNIVIKKEKEKKKKRKFLRL